MNCLHHPETPAALVCECGTALCHECAARRPDVGCPTCVAAKTSQEVAGAVTDTVMVVVGAIAGAAAFYALTRSWSEVGGALTFTVIGAEWPFGWRALRFWSALGTSYSAWGSNLVVVVLIWMTPLFLLVLKMWVAMLIGVPALVVTALRRVVVLLGLRSSRLSQPA
ncbi:hypothetical protein D4740_06260 [Actinomyces sp. 2119]|uniref:B-box zinc finger protein n=1 Tax=Actinomyces sp. 2119 TaxID=2321393 RepID=UPI000E6BD884|nr:B-box zinc finger protein [Actinomyces sp. 2119]RJF42538.1 hypothetical protein D4740_06260 [Actinomyces sp. 2119]